LREKSGGVITGHFEREVAYGAASTPQRETFVALLYPTGWAGAASLHTRDPAVPFLQ